MFAILLCITPEPEIRILNHPHWYRRMSYCTLDTEGFKDKTTSCSRICRHDASIPAQALSLSLNLKSLEANFDIKRLPAFRSRTETRLTRLARHSEVKTQFKATNTQSKDPVGLRLRVSNWSAVELLSRLSLDLFLPVRKSVDV